MNKQVNTLNKYNDKEKLILASFGLLLGFTLLAWSSMTALGVTATSITVSDGDSNDENANSGTVQYGVDTSVTVASACTMTADNTSHTGALSPGSSTEITGATFEIICNDASGFSIYAIGSSGDTDGTTAMIASAGSTYNIATGTATSGDTSNWAMKVSAVSGSYTPTIENDYDSYSVVPSSSTKVATYAAQTGASAGSSITANYRVYTASTQEAGTYTGKVKYMMVHPSTE